MRREARKTGQVNACYYYVISNLTHEMLTYAHQTLMFIAMKLIAYH